MIDTTRREVVLGAAASASVPALPGSERDRDLMMRFCSLGNNCEVGFAQRSFGAEPLDLLRWAGTPYDVLMLLLKSRFFNIGNPDEIVVAPGATGEMMVHHIGYGFIWHAYSEPGASASDIRVREVKRLPFLAQKITNEIKDASRIFVVKSIAGVTAATDLLREMESYGGHPTLMFVTDGAETPTVEAITPHLLHGKIVQFADQTNVPKFTHPNDWLTLFRKAVDLMV